MAQHSLVGQTSGWSFQFASLQICINLISSIFFNMMNQSPTFVTNIDLPWGINFDLGQQILNPSFSRNKRCDSKMESSWCDPIQLRQFNLLGKVQNYGFEKMKRQIEKFNKIRDGFMQYCVCGSIKILNTVNQIWFTFPKESSWSTSDGDPSVKYYVMVKDYII